MNADSQAEKDLAEMDLELKRLYPSFDELTPGQQRILEAALALFAEKGFASASTGAIARQAGVAEGLIFKHFRSKKELFLKLVRPLVLDAFFPLSIKRIKRIIQQEDLPLEEVLEQILRERLDFARQHRRILRVMLQEIWLHPELMETLAELFQIHMRATIEARFELFVARGEVWEMPFGTFLRLVLSAFMGFVIPRVLLFPHLEWDDEREIRDTVQTLLRGLTPEAEA